jgi:ADP-ribosylglycohydrolase
MGATSLGTLEKGPTSMRSKPSDRAKLALEGLSIGDAFGQQFFAPGIPETARPDRPPPPTWRYTDDTEMAIAIVQVLETCGQIDQDVLAKRFADRHADSPNRGYGAGARRLLWAIHGGADWRIESKAMFSGMGSFGNGAAMRVAPLGAWFADDEQHAIEQAIRSAEVTHAHPEGIAGAQAVALAAVWACCFGDSTRKSRAREMIPWVIDRMPASEVRTRLEWAATYDLDDWPFTLASQVGCGLQITAQDTVPLCLWLAASRLDDFSGAVWQTARIGGDIDTNCAIVGGIVALAVGNEGIAEHWRRSRERLAW